AARIVVKRANVPTGGHQAARQRAADEASATSDEYLLTCDPAHDAFPPTAVAFGMRTRTSDARRRRSRRRCVSPQTNQRKYSAVHGPSLNVDVPPYSRSIDTMGTSPSLRPCIWALMAIS